MPVVQENRAVRFPVVDGRGELCVASASTSQLTFSRLLLLQRILSGKSSVFSAVEVWRAAKAEVERLVSVST